MDSESVFFLKASFHSYVLTWILREEACTRKGSAFPLIFAEVFEEGSGMFLVLTSLTWLQKAAGAMSNYWPGKGRIQWVI